jgi:hypothetical protein
MFSSLPRTLPIIKAILLGVMLLAAPVYAANYTTTLTLQPGSAPNVARVVWHWSTDVASGAVGPSDLSNFSMEIYSTSALLYRDEIISGGVFQPLPGQAAARSAADATWDFNLDSMELSQFRNVGDSAVQSASGYQVQVQDNATLLIDGQVIVIEYLDTVNTGFAFGALLSQATTMSCALVPPPFVASTSKNIGGKTYVRGAVTESLCVDFKEPNTATNLEYSGLVEVVISGTGQSNGASYNDAFYGFDINYPANTWTYSPLGDYGALHHLAVNARSLTDSGHSPATVTNLVAYDPSLNGGTSIDAQGYFPPYRLDHTYSFVIDVRDTEANPGSVASKLHLGVIDGGFNDNSGQYNITLYQLDGPVSVDAPWSGSGTPSTEVISDGSAGAAVFTYDNGAPGSSGANGSWEFSAVATTNATVDMDYRFTGFHAFFQVTAGLEAFAMNGGNETVISVVNAGPKDNGQGAPSGGFSYAGTVTSLSVTAGEKYGFRMKGSNYDSNSRLQGRLEITTVGYVPVVPTVPNPIADETVAEDADTFQVDVANTFSPQPGLALSIVGNTNPSLFSSASLSNTSITLQPAENQNGSANITVRAADGAGQYVDDTFTVTVTPDNDPPVVYAPLIVAGLETDGPAISINLLDVFGDVDIDIEGDALNFVVESSVAGVVTYSNAVEFLTIEPGNLGSTELKVTATDNAGEAAVTSATITLLGEAVLVQAATRPVTDENGSRTEVVVAVHVTGPPGTTAQTVELFSSASCVDGVLDESTAVVFGEFGVGEYDEDGEAFLYSAFATEVPISSYATARITGSGSAGTSSSCIIAGADNDSWFRALDMNLENSGGESTATVTGFLDSAGNARWYRFPITPGAEATVELSNLPADYDLFVFKDINQAFNVLEGNTDIEGLNRLSAEFAPSVFSPSVFSPSVFSPSVFSPDAYAPSVFSPSVFSPSVFSPSVFSPSVFSPSVFSPSVFSPSVFSPSVFSPSVFSPSVFSPSVFSPSVFSGENFASAQMRSLVAVEAQTGTGTERVSSDTWNNTGYYYVRVSGKNGEFDIENPFELSVSVDGVNCTGVVPKTATVSAPGGDYASIILWDSARVAADPDNSSSDIEALEAQLNELALRGEVNGVLVDLNDFAHVQASHDQADANTSCPYAENLTAQAIKDIIDAYRQQNPNMAYVVIAGSDSHIPFFRYPDQGLLGPEQDYDPPVANGTQSLSALRLNYILGQDEYGASTSLSLRDGAFPLPDLAVGRLVETAAEMNTVLAAYLATANGVIDQPTSALITGYDFLTDSATAVKNELAAGMLNARIDTLIDPADLSPDDPLAWNADQLREKLLVNGEDIVFLAGHFSAIGTLAADYKTSMLSTELVASSADYTNSIVFSAGCHSGYNIVNEDGVAGVTRVDWTQAFAQKGATLIAGTGYQYGDTDFIEYSERLYVQFARELRTGSGPVSVGQAMVRAKQQYLESTPDVRGLHRKSLLISTVFGLPMLSVDLAGERITRPVSDPLVEPAAITGNPGVQLGLHVATVNFEFPSNIDGDLVDTTVYLTNLDGGGVTTTYLTGSDGVVTNPAEPALPLVTRDVTVAGLSLRGVGFRRGSWSERDIVPLTGAPTTELRGVHTPFTSPVNFPMRMATANYYNALAGGETTLLHVTPAQHRAADLQYFLATLRQFDDMEYRLYYSNNSQTYGPNTPALAGPPTMSSVQAVIDGDDVIFFVNVIGDPAAGIQSVWVTYTEGESDAGAWESLDLLQDPNNEDSSLWTQRLVGGAADFLRLDYLVQAANGTGLVTLDDNYGSYYQVAGFLDEVDEEGNLPPVFNASELVFDAPSASASGTYGSRVTVTATLSSIDLPIADAEVLFTIGATGRYARTDGNGVAEISMPLYSTPGQYTLTASFAGDKFDAALPEQVLHAESSAEQTFSITRTDTSLLIHSDAQSVGVEGIESGVIAILVAGDGTELDIDDYPIDPLLQRTVYFTIYDDSGDFIGTAPVITDNFGRARLGQLALPAGTYSVTAQFLGEIVTSDPAKPLVLSDDVYEESATSTTLVLEGNVDCPTEEYGAKSKKSGKSKKSSKSGKLKLEGFCYLTHDVNGQVEITDGTLVVGEDVQVTRKIDQKGAGSVYIREFAVALSEVHEHGPGDVTVAGTIEGHLHEHELGGILIDESGVVNGKVEEKNDGTVTIHGTVNGDVKEDKAGNLIIGVTGVVEGKAEEKGEGRLSNDGFAQSTKESDAGKSEKSKKSSKG